MYNVYSGLEVKLTDTYQATWVFVVLGDLYDIKTGEWRSDSHSLLSAQELWFAVFMTILFVTLPDAPPPAATLDIY